MKKPKQLRWPFVLLFLIAYTLPGVRCYGANPASPPLFPHTDTSDEREFQSFYQGFQNVAPKGTLFTDVKDRQARGDGKTDDSTAILSAGNSGPIVIPSGTYFVGANIVFPNYVAMLPGASLSIASGKTVIFNGGFSAPPRQVFSGTGTAVLAGLDSSPVAYAEWWGALSDGTTDDCKAIQSAINAMTHGGTLQLLTRAYTCKSAVRVATQSLTIRGTTAGLAPIDYGSGGADGTRIIGTNGINTLTVSNVGYFKLMDVDMYLPEGASTATIGLNLLSCFYPKVVDVRITNYSTAIHLNANSDAYIHRCYLSSTGVMVTPVVGLDDDSLGHAQNASLFISDCISAHGGYSGSAYGYWVHGNRTNDLFMDHDEADGCTYGYFIDGSAVDPGFGADMHVRGCVADSSVTYGFYVVGSQVDSELEITDGWANSASVDMYIVASRNVRVAGMQFYGGNDGLYIVSSSQVVATGNLFNYQAQNSITLDHAVFCTVANNTGWQNSAAGANFINLIVANHNAIMGNTANSSVSGGFNYGVVADVQSDYCNVIGNVINSPGTTKPYTLNLGANTHTVQLGTTN